MMLFLFSLSGGDAFERASHRPHLTEAEVAHYTRQVLQGLNYIHTRNHMHLDLKVRNRRDVELG